MKRFLNFVVMPALLLALTFTACQTSREIAGTQTETKPAVNPAILPIKAELDGLAANPTLEGYTNIAERFGQLREEQPNDWLTYYYEAFSWLKVSLAGPISDVDTYSDRALGLLSKAEKLPHDTLEVYVLQALGLSSKIRVNVMARGMQYAQMSSQLLQEVVDARPNHPRALLLAGENLFNRPGIFGGGPEPAKPYFERACAAFAAEQEQGVVPGHPDWGAQTATLKLQECEEAARK